MICCQMRNVSHFKQVKIRTLHEPINRKLPETINREKLYGITQKGIIL